MQAEGYPHPCNGAGRSGKGGAKRRSAQAQRGRLGKRLAGAWGLAPLAAFLGSALRAGTGPQRWVADDAKRQETGRRPPPLSANLIISSGLVVIRDVCCRSGSRP